MLFELCPRSLARGLTCALVFDRSSSIAGLRSLAISGGSRVVPGGLVLGVAITLHSSRVYLEWWSGASILMSVHRKMNCTLMCVHRKMYCILCVCIARCTPIPELTGHRKIALHSYVCAS